MCYSSLPLSTILGFALAAAFLGSLFAAADAAVTGLSDAELQYLAEGANGARFQRFQREGTRILARWLACRTVFVSLSAVFFTEVTRAKTDSRWLGIAMAVGCAFVAYGSLAQILISLARARPDRISAFSLSKLRILEMAVAPIAEPLSWLGKFVERRFPRQVARNARITETEMQWALSEGQKAGALGREPAEMIRNVLEFKDLTVRDVMVPRTKVVAIDVASPLARVVAYVAQEGHSRYPVYRDSVDNIVGLLYAKDLFAIPAEVQKGKKLEEILRVPVLYVAESERVPNVLRDMRAKRLHLAVVTDAFGGTSGVVTLEDIIEEIVGDIRDEYDTHEEQRIEETSDGRLFADATVSISDLSAKLGRTIPIEGDYESLGGLILHKVGRVPEIGAVVELDHLRLIVRDADAAKVKRIEIIPIRHRTSETGAAAENVR